MAVSPWLAITLTLRRWTLFVLALCCVSSVLIPFSPNIEGIYALRLLQGFAGGLTIPLLMTTALRVLTPDIRLYGLAVYALTATFTPALASTLGAFWVDVVDWRFVFLEALPLCTLSAVLVWYGLPQDPPQLQRFNLLDWRGVLLLVIGMGAFSTMLYQGDRLNWFDSRFISVLALVSVVAIPALLVNEWFHPLPFLKLQLLGRRNFAYGAVGLFLFLVIAQSGSTVPLAFLQQVQGFRPQQSNVLTLAIAASQLVMLPAMAVLLDRRWADARAVSFIGLSLILASCIAASRQTSVGSIDQFILSQGLQAVGQPMVVMPLLMMSTNTIKKAEEGPFASALVNVPRGIAEAVGVWLTALITRWRGAFHYDHIVDQIGLDRWRTIQGNGVLAQYPTPLLADGQQRTPGALQALSQAVELQTSVLTSNDTFMILGGLAVVLMIVLLVLPVRTMPPRIEFAKS